MTSFYTRAGAHLQLWVALMFLFLTTTAQAQTEGQLHLTFMEVDQNGQNALPAFKATITLSGENLIGGNREKVTDVNGEVAFNHLPPGKYEVEAISPTTEAITFLGIRVVAGHTTTRVLGLRPAGTAVEIDVVSEHAINTSSTTSGTTLSKDMLSRIPTGRSYQSAVSTAAGITGGGRGKRPAGRAPLPPRPGPVVTKGGARDYGINGVFHTAEDSLSTFAVDVDTASYTMARKTLTAGYLPIPAAVRVEEFVNYLQYNYAAPVSNEPFAVDLEAAPSPWDPRLTVVRIGVQGRSNQEETRKPAHLTFLVDVSGSMATPDKLKLVKESLLMLSGELKQGDTVAIATYAGSIHVALEPTSATDQGAILHALNNLRAGGSTAMSSGIELAYQLASERLQPGTVNRVIICSDGDANVGQIGPDAIAPNIQGFAKKGITLTTLGFGTGNYQDTMMERLANQGDGNYFYIDGVKEAQRVLVDKLSGTLEVIAKDVKIQVDWNPATVEHYRLIGYENRDIADEDFRVDAVDAGEIGAEHQVTALYEVRLKDQSASPLGTIYIRSKPPGPDAPAAERQWSMPHQLVQDSYATTSPDYKMASSAAYFAELLRESPHLPDATFDSLADLVQDARRARVSDDQELLRLIRNAAALSKASGAGQD